MAEALTVIRVNRIAPFLAVVCTNPPLLKGGGAVFPRFAAISHARLRRG
jgi:hypothetical protein